MIRQHIKNHEVGLLFRRGDFHRVLAPGMHWLPGVAFGRDQVQVLSTLDTRFNHPLLDVLIQNPELRERLLVVDLAEDQRALVWREGRLFDVIGPGRHAYWQAPFSLRVETFTVADVELRHPQLDAVLATTQARAHLAAVDVEQHERLLVRRGGEVIADVGPGRHAFWTRANVITWKAVDLREQLADAQGQEIMTADKVTLRVNLVVAWRIVDAVAATTVVDSAAGAVYREAQLALRVAVGTRDLERLLADKDLVANEVRAAVTPRVLEFGVAVRSVGIKDIILPGEMKTLLNQVIEAQKQAEANLIRRREETAAARSQANTARLLAENPMLLRMKELEALQGILAGAKTSFVFGGGDLAQQIKGLLAPPADG
ncbi:MAG: slipin family protein [Planctomycetes bacterium]|nr:slipin family protein [Planctomycetota bacterium]